MPLAVEQFDLSGYDLVISSSHAVAKGVITGPGQLHVSYPTRHTWRAASTRSTAAPPPWSIRRFDVDRFGAGGGREDFFLTASRLVPYKKVALIVEAFAAMPDKRLVVIGDGPDLARIQAMATPNVSVLGYQSTDVLVDHMQRARAFVFAAEEDFGIVAVEAQACGTPVIALGRGGVRETVVDSQDRATRTGVFFARQTVEDVVRAVCRFEDGPPVDPAACRRNAVRFSPERFRAEFLALVRKTVEQAAAAAHAATAPPAAIAGAGALLVPVPAVADPLEALPH